MVQKTSNGNDNSSTTASSSDRDDQVTSVIDFVAMTPHLNPSSELDDDDLIPSSILTLVILIFLRLNITH